MSTLQVKEVNAETGEETLRDMNAAELAELAQSQKERQAQEAAEAKAATDKAALLTKLGITAEEAALLLS
jgi:hypothetical protein